MPCPKTYLLMTNPSSPNKATKYLDLFVLCLLIGKYNIGGKIHTYVHSNNNESLKFRAINWLSRTMSERGSIVK